MVEQRVLIPSVQVRVPVPQPSNNPEKILTLIKLFPLKVKILLIIIVLSKNLYAQADYIALFYKSLLEWNIDYKSLEEYKAGAACLNKERTNANKMEALGFSFQSYDINRIEN